MTNEYTTVCDKCYKKTWYETEQQCHMEYQDKKYCESCNQSLSLQGNEFWPMKRCTGTLRAIDNSELDQRFKEFYERRERVEVTYTDGTKERFYVGKSTGWKPVYLAIKTRVSNGGIAICSSLVKDIKRLSIYK